jgi:hypothetical protein
MAILPAEVEGGCEVEDVRDQIPFVLLRHQWRCQALPSISHVVGRWDLAGGGVAVLPRRAAGTRLWVRSAFLTDGGRKKTFRQGGTKVRRKFLKKKMIKIYYK